MRRYVIPVVFALAAVFACGCEAKVDDDDLDVDVDAARSN